MSPYQGGVAMKSKFPGAVPEIPVRDIKELGLAGISKGNCRVFLANLDYRKEHGNIGPVLIWLNLESKRKLMICTDYGAIATLTTVLAVGVSENC
jgi:hypothetical protein